MKKETAFVLFVEIAESIEEIYGVPTIIDEDEESKTFGEIIGYHCPLCGEIILWEDWEAYYCQSVNNCKYCPICEEELEVD